MNGKFDISRYEGCTIHVIGHRNPDADSVGSAIAFSYFLNRIGIHAEAAVCGKTGNETKYALDLFGIPVPQYIENAAGKQFVLVDHSSYAQAAAGMEHADVCGIIDHHEPGGIVSSDPQFTRYERSGAAASLVYRFFAETDMEIPKHIAQVMLMSILSDTRGMKRNVTDADEAAYSALLPISGIHDTDEFYRKMRAALADYGIMSPADIFLSDYKEYHAGDFIFGIADVNAAGEENVRRMADCMDTVIKEGIEGIRAELLFVIINNTGAGENMMYMIAGSRQADMVLQDAFGNYDGTRYHVFRENLSRKTEVVPVLERILENRKGKTVRS